MATILIVEDDRNMRLLTAARLGDKYTTVCACDGIEALDIIHKGGIDMVVADVMMPRMDGYELLKTARGEGYTIPYLLLTAKESLSDKQLGFSFGTDDYMTKPFSSDELLWRVEALLRRANIAQSKKIKIGSVTVDSESGEETIKTHISRIRARLNDIDEFGITTIKGLGYKADISGNK